MSYRLLSNTLRARVLSTAHTRGTVHVQQQSQGTRQTCDTVCNLGIRSPKKSHLHRSQELRFSPSSLLLYDHELKLFPYNIYVRHKLNAEDKERKHVRCISLSQKLERTLGWINHIWFFDEAHFHINSSISNHNSIFWGSGLPEEITERQLNTTMVTAFVAYNARHGVLGSYWYEGGRTVTINTKRYLKLIR